MKKLFTVLAAVLLFASCSKKDNVTPVAPTHPEVEHAAYREPPGGGGTSNYRYCYTTTQINIDLWQLSVNRNPNIALPSGLQISYDVNGVNTGWSAITSWPVIIYTGYGSGVSNIKIKEPCFSFGGPCVDPEYGVGPCQ